METNNEPEFHIVTNGFTFSAEQLREVEEAATYLAALINRFGISNREISRQDAQEFAAKEPNRIFSQGGDYRGRWHLSAGFTDGFDFYYVSRLPFEELPSSYPETEIILYCVICDGEAVVGDDEEQCSNCEDGSLTFDLEWDENGVVTAINTLPPQ